MKRKTLTVTLVILVLLMAVVSIAIAQNVRTVNADTYWRFSDPSTQVNGSATTVQAEGGETACNVTRAGLLKWDVSDIADTATVGNATIVLHGVTNNVNADGATLGLFEAPDNWDETTTQGNLPGPPDPPSTATPLATVTGPFPASSSGGNIIFSASGTSDPLIQYIQSQVAGDNTVSFWVEFVSDCPGGGTALLAWNSREAGTSTMELSTPTSVTLSTFSASDSNTVNWTLILGLFALAAVVVVGVGYGVRRSKQS